MTIREAKIEDWDKLLLFYKRIYRQNHPLQNKEFWEWQYGDENFGRAFISINDNGDIVGHVGANFGGNIAWMINAYLDEECRGKGVLTELYSLARKYYPLAATAANEAGLGLYRNMRWYRYHDLVRYVKINPKFNINSTLFQDVCKSVHVVVDDLRTTSTHFFQQPFTKAIRLEDGSTGISQENVGGLRIVDISELDSLEKQVWDLGYSWIDYITSWNDLNIKNLEKNNWKIDYKSCVPWRLNPVQENYFCDITYLSEYPLDREFIVHRSFSDHGRIGSIK